jgi:hypothetical protein
MERPELLASNLEEIAGDGVLCGGTIVLLPQHRFLFSAVPKGRRQQLGARNGGMAARPTR